MIHYCKNCGVFEVCDFEECKGIVSCCPHCVRKQIQELKLKGVKK